MRSKPGVPKNNSNKGTQIRKNCPLRCKSTKCHNDHYAYKTKECIELQYMINSTTQNKEELKEMNYRAIFKKR